MFVPHKKAGGSAFGITPQKRKRDFNRRFQFQSAAVPLQTEYNPQVVQTIDLVPSLSQPAAGASRFEGTPSRNVEAEVCGALPREIDIVQMINDAAESGSPRPRHQNGHIDNSGWAWLCTDKQVFLWEHRELTQASVEPVAFIRPLPTANVDGTPEIFTAPLVKVWQDKYSVQRPGLTVVSPSGIVWFWAEIHARERPPIAINLPLDDGEACVELIAIEEAGFLVATNKGSLYQILVWTNHQLRARKFRASGGLIQGLGKMLGFGGEVKQPGARTLLLLDTSGMAGEQDSKKVVVVLTEETLQQWKVSNDSEDGQLVHEYQLLEEMRGTLGEEMDKIWLLDLKQTPKASGSGGGDAGFLALVAWRRNDSDDEIGYSLVKLDVAIGQSCAIDGVVKDLEHKVSDFKEEVEGEGDYIDAGSERLPPGSLQIVPAGSDPDHAYVYWAPSPSRSLVICGMVVTAGLQNTSKVSIVQHRTHTHTRVTRLSLPTLLTLPYARCIWQVTFSVPSLDMGQNQYSADGILGAGAMPNRPALLLMSAQTKQVIRAEVKHGSPSSEGGVGASVASVLHILYTTCGEAARRRGSEYHLACAICTISLAPFTCLCMRLYASVFLCIPLYSSVCACIPLYASCIRWSSAQSARWPCRLDGRRTNGPTLLPDRRQGSRALRTGAEGTSEGPPQLRRQELQLQRFQGLLALQSNSGFILVTPAPLCLLTYNACPSVLADLQRLPLCTY
jgi:hypothetical protein